MNSTFTASVPHLHTERLLLREYRRADFESFADHHPSTPGAARVAPIDRLTAWRIFCTHAGLWLIHGAGWWSVEDRRTGQLVGSVGAFFREEASPMELGWNTYGAFAGQGFATEAATAVLQYVFETRGEPKVHALIDPGNAASLGVAQRLGMVYESETTLHGNPIGRYTRLRPGATA